MDCRKFHKNLEDYLEDGLDFAGRFGMERHAQQCIGCGKELASAQKLRAMVRGLDRVKAPVNFEAELLAGIARRKTHSRLFPLRRLWLYGFELPSLKKMVAVSASVAALAFGVLYYSNGVRSGASTLPPAVPQAALPAVAPVTAEPEPVDAIVAAAPAPVRTELQEPVAQKALQRDDSPEMLQVAEAAEPAQIESAAVVEEPEAAQIEYTDYIEYRMFGPGNRPVSLRVPNTPRVRYGQTPEEYFIRNVSH